MPLGRVVRAGLLVLGFAFVFAAYGGDRGQPELALRGVTSSPIEPPEADDRTFVRNEEPGELDTGCTFAEGGPLLIHVPVTRYAGSTDAGGHLLHAEQLIEGGLLSEFADLLMPAYDINFHDGDADNPPERDRVYFNGTPVQSLYSENPDFLHGAGGIWRMNLFRIPIRHVRFPTARGANRQSPIPAINEIRIDIDILTGDSWCTAIDWVALRIQATSPIILIHGNNSDGAFFTRQGFTQSLSTRRLPWDSSINMETTSVARNALQLDADIPRIAREVGVDSVHLVAHSKGGLDARSWLTEHYPKRLTQLKVLSLTTLSTPHNGSVLADIPDEGRKAAEAKALIDYSGFPTLVATIGQLYNPDAGVPDLTTSATAKANVSDLHRLPEDVVFNAVAADADSNDNGEIDAFPDEFQALRIESGMLSLFYALDNTVTAELVDRLYQTLRSVRSVEVDKQSRVLEGYECGLWVAEAIPSFAPLTNDTFVTMKSGFGAGSFGHRVAMSQGHLQPFYSINHASVGGPQVANAAVIPWILDTEREKGDLREHNGP